MKTSELGFGLRPPNNFVGHKQQFSEEVMWILPLRRFLLLEVMLELGVDAK